MALRDQPYLPLYIQDFLTDEKLSECSASSTGVYVRLMCLMHKSEHYGKILLKQKHKQTGKQIQDFASLFAKSMPYDSACIIAALTELLEEKVIKIEGDFLVQKRMVRDNEISIKRSETGSLGGKSTQSKNKKFALANEEANTEYENEDFIPLDGLGGEGGKGSFIKFPLPEHFNGLPDITMGAVRELVSITKKINLTDEEISGMWTVFKNQSLTGKKYYNDESDVYSHFVNWMKKQNFKENAGQQAGTSASRAKSNSKSAGAYQLLEQLKAEDRRNQP